MKFKSVFDCYPDADKLFVVGDMPFLKAGEAENHAKTVQGKVEIVTRESQYQETTDLEPFIGDPEKEAADKAAAELKAEQAAQKAAEKEAAAKSKAE